MTLLLPLPRHKKGARVEAEVVGGEVEAEEEVTKEMEALRKRGGKREICSLDFHKL